MQISAHHKITFLLQLRQGLENYRLANPYQHAIFHLTHFTTTSLFEPEDQLQALSNVTLADLQQHIQQVFSRAYLETLTHGNITAEVGGLFHFFMPALPHMLSRRTWPGLDCTRSANRQASQV